MASSQMPQGGRYLGKVEMVAVLLHGGVSESDLLKLPHVRCEDLEAAKDLLRQALNGFAREMDDYVESVKDMK